MRISLPLLIPLGKIMMEIMYTIVLAKEFIWPLEAFSRRHGDLYLIGLVCHGHMIHFLLMRLLVILMTLAVVGKEDMKLLMFTLGYFYSVVFQSLVWYSMSHVDLVRILIRKLTYGNACGNV